MQQSCFFLLDALSVIVKTMLGTIQFKLRDTLGWKAGVRGEEISFGDKDVVLAGDLKQTAPPGDEPMWREGDYFGKRQNELKGSEVVFPGMKSTKKLARLGMMARNIFHDVVLFRHVHGVRDPGSDVPEEKLDFYRKDAAEFLRVTQAMADCTWKHEDRVWLARRNRTVLQMTPEGRAELQKFESAFLLMDGRKTRITGETGADHMNLVKLKQLA